MRRSAWIPAALLCCLLGCGDGSRISEASSALLAASNAPLPPDAEDGDEGSGAPGPGASRVPGEPEAASIQPEASQRVYYQFVDESGSVRFVDRLEQVPPQWRDRVGVVELAAAPSSSPRDAAQARSQRLTQLRESSSRAAVAGRPAGGVILYYADWCPYCRKARAYLDGRGVAYDLRDVDVPSVKQELLRKTGRTAIPVIDVGGRIVTGFDERQLARLLADAS